MGGLWLAGFLFLASPVSAEAATSTAIVESVELRGISVLRQRTLRDQLEITVDAPLDEDQVRAARARLLASGLFRSVRASLKKGSARGRVIVVFVCTERGTASIDAFHLGHARPTELWAGLEVSDLDPFALGFSLGGGLVASEDQFAGRLTVGRRGLFSPHLELALSGFFIDGLEPVVDETRQFQVDPVADDIGLPYRRAGGDLSGRHRVGPISVLFGVRGEWVSGGSPVFRDVLQGPAEPPQPAPDYDLPFGDSVQTVLSVGFEYDARDDPAHPTSGLRASLLGRAGTGAGSFAGALLGFDHYLPLAFGHVLRTDAKAGALFGDPPFFEQFFIGDLHPYIPARALGLNFSRRGGPNLIDSTIVDQRYETIAGRLGLEYRIPLARSGPDDRYGVEIFFGIAVLSLFTPEAEDTPVGTTSELPPVDFPIDAAIDFGLRIDSEIGVIGISVGNIFLLVDP